MLLQEMRVHSYSGITQVPLTLGLLLETVTPDVVKEHITRVGSDRGELSASHFKTAVLTVPFGNILHVWRDPEVSKILISQCTLACQGNRKASSMSPSCSYLHRMFHPSIFPYKNLSV
jgi:hypothetical protein